jgi:uncharacterized protein
MQAHLKFLKWLAIACCALLLGATPCKAADLVAVPRATGLILDQTQLLTDAERGGIERRLAQIQASGQAQIGILVSAGTGDEALASYALRVAEAWKLGGKDSDNGLLILIVPSKGAARIEVGYGLEGAIPDVRAGQFVRDYLQRMKDGGAAASLNALLDQVVHALPPGSRLPRALTQFVNRHADWKTPIVMLVLSAFTLFPLLFASVFGGLGGTAGAGNRARAWPSAGTGVAALVSACLFAAVVGLGARSFWDSTAIGGQAAAIAFALPLLWSLNTCDRERMGGVARIGRIAGNLGLFAYLFAALTIVAGAAMYVENVREIWVAPLLGGLFAAGPLVFILGGRVGAALMRLLGGYMYFLVALAITYFALQGVLKDPTATAFTLAAVFAALLAIGGALDDREQRARGGRRRGGWAWMFTAAAVLFLLPFMLVALVHALLGEAFSTRFAMVMAGDGTFSQLVWWASGALGGSALLVGLGGKFGGGGAGN